MQAKRKLIQGTATYQGEQVDILDAVYVAGMSEVEYMVNYNGPVWVKASWLNNVTWIID